MSEPVNFDPDTNTIRTPIDEQPTMVRVALERYGYLRQDERLRVGQLKGAERKLRLVRAAVERMKQERIDIAAWLDKNVDGGADVWRELVDEMLSTAEEKSK